MSGFYLVLDAFYVVYTIKKDVDDISLGIGYHEDW